MSGLIPFVEVKQLATDLSVSRLLPQALQKQPADLMVILLTGQELGLQPMQAVRSIFVVDGKPTLSADIIGALCMRSPVCEYLQPAESTDAVATYVAKRRGAPSEVRMSFTMAQAKAAGLQGKGNWSKYPAAMLRARALAAICRAVFPDVVAGIYDPDELGGPVDVAPVQVASPSAEAEAKKPAPSTPQTAPAMEAALKASIAAVEAPKASPPKARKMVIQEPQGEELACIWLEEARGQSPATLDAVRERIRGLKLEGEARKRVGDLYARVKATCIGAPVAQLERQPGEDG